MKLTARNFILTWLVVVSISLTACGHPRKTTIVVLTSQPPTATKASATEAPTRAATEAPIVVPSNPNLILATTTSTQDSGLLDVLMPMFEEQTGYKVQTVAAGSGQAMEMGQQGNADVLLVHAPTAEKKFMAENWGKDRALVMHNDFIIVGP